MDIKEFLEKFAEQFDDTDSSSFAPETRFRDLSEWSSIMGLSIIAMIDEEYKVALKAVDMNKAQTVEDLFEIVREKSN